MFKGTCPMLDTTRKEASILLLFIYFLRDYVNFATILVVSLITFLVFFKISLPKIVRSILIIALFISYWAIYGKMIDPEIGLNFLITITSFKILEKESKRDQYMIFYGLVLVLSAGALFEKSLVYVGFFFISFIVLIKNFYFSLNQSLNRKRAIRIFIWISPVTLTLFFLVPRSMNPLSLVDSKPDIGEIGYTSSMQISDLETLNPSDKVAFSAKLSKSIANRNLYWRGNTLSFSDGWNWPITPFDEIVESGNPLFGTDKNFDLIIQEIRTNGNLSYFFGLDYPYELKFADKKFYFVGKKTREINKWMPINKYTISSQILRNDGELTPNEMRRYTKISLDKESHNWINNQFQGTTIEEISLEVKEYFRDQKFSYSLSPGKVVSLLEFMTKTKKGLCSHYSSALAHILRVKGFPSRVVSGYMGGDYNQYAQVYVVKQNDAHAWVEVFSNKQWIRIDPTEWISPERVILGGDLFVKELTEKGTAFVFNRFQFKMIIDIQKWFQQWDYRFYQWIEDMDYYSQEAILQNFNLNRTRAFWLSLLLIVLFPLIYLYQLKKSKKKNKLERIYDLWDDLFKKLELKKISFNRNSVLSTERNVVSSGDQTLIEIWKKMVRASYAEEVNDDDLKEIRRKLKTIQ